MTTNAAIETVELRKEYNDEVAVEDLTISIERGTIYGFLGPNGAGKTTTMRMLTTLTKPTSGTAYVAGEPITDRDAVTANIGYLPEETPVYEELTAREQLAYFGAFRDMAEETVEKRANTLLTRLDLAGDADKRISTYSKGMRRKVGLIQSVLHEPDIVFLDEPTSGLDPRAARSMRELIADLANDETTVFLSTHILPVADELADTIGVLHDGRLVAESSPDEMKRRAETGGERTLEDAFLEITTERSQEKPSNRSSI